MCKVLLVVTTVQIKIREYKSLFTASPETKTEAKMIKDKKDKSRQDKTKKDSCTG